jgi:uncharacterized protein (DUF433 family)
MEAALHLETYVTEPGIQSWGTQGTKREPFPRTYGSHLPHGLNISLRRQVSTRMVLATEHPHIVRDPRIGYGEPIIRGTGVRVRILMEYWRLDTPIEELLQYFPHLTLAQVLDALSYYQDHQEEMNVLINLNRPDNLPTTQPNL